MNLHFCEYMGARFESPSVLGRRTLARLGECMRTAMRDRTTLSASGHRFVDVYYDAFINDTVGTLQELYKDLDLDFDTDFASRVEKQLAADSKRRQTRTGSGHRYDLATFGLSEVDVDKEFKAYLAEYFSA